MTRRHVRLALCLATGWLAGCATDADYRRPDIDLAAEWPTKVSPGEAALGGVQAIDWHSAFPDPRLQGLIAAALEHNADLHIAVARVAEARAQAAIAGADRLPQLDAVFQRNASLTPGDLNATGRPLGSQRYDANIGVTAFELDFWGRVRNLDAAATANYLASQYAQRAFRLSLINDVVSAYLSLIELQERQAMAEASRDSRAETRRLVAARRDVGLAGDLDVLAADSAWQGARAEVAALARQRTAAENSLTLLTGKTVDLPAGRRLEEQGLAAAPAIGLPADVLLARPDVMAAEQKLQAAHANLAAARAAFFPRIVLTATAGTASRALAGLFAGGSGAWAFAPVLRWPLFDGERREANADLMQARRHVAVAEYEKTVQQAFREVADLLAARQALTEQLQAQQAQRDTQAQRLRLVDLRHRGGVASYLELLDAQRDHFAAEQAVTALRRQSLAATASLYKALGSL